MEDDSKYILPIELDKKGQLDALRSTASIVPTVYLRNYIAGFVKDEMFEEACIIRDELNSRKQSETDKVKKVIESIHHAAGR